MQISKTDDAGSDLNLPLFGRDPPKTVNVARAVRILVDGLLVGHKEAAEIHGIGEVSIRRLHRMRDISPDLDQAVKMGLCHTPGNLTNVARLRAWASRPDGTTTVEISENGEVVVLREFVPGLEDNRVDADTT
jgi:hypothetical protein